MPIPQSGESRDEFISRCIPVVLNDGTAESQDQAVAICSSLWSESRSKDPFAAPDEILHSQPVKVYVRKEDGTYKLEVLGAPYGGHLDGKDADGEFFSPQTNFMLDIGDRRPVLYYHGRDPDGHMEKQVEVIGTATATRRDTQGLWFEVVLDKTKKYAERIYRAAVDGLARASSGALNYLVRRGVGGELLQWPIGELTLIDKQGYRQPANELASVHLKTLFSDAGLDFPEGLLKSEELESKSAEPIWHDKQILTEIALRRPKNG
jgi:hypothetical protein